MSCQLSNPSNWDSTCIPSEIDHCHWPCYCCLSVISKWTYFLKSHYLLAKHNCHIRQNVCQMLRCKDMSRQLVPFVTNFYTSDRWSYSKGWNSPVDDSPKLVISTCVTQMGFVSCTFHQGLRSPESVEEPENPVLPSTAIPATSGVSINTYVLLWFAGRSRAKFTSPVINYNNIESHTQPRTTIWFTSKYRHCAYLYAGATPYRLWNKLECFGSIVIIVQ